MTVCGIPRAERCAVIFVERELAHFRPTRRKSNIKSHALSACEEKSRDTTKKIGTQTIEPKKKDQKKIVQTISGRTKAPF